jgi:hypothetical protein
MPYTASSTVPSRNAIQAAQIIINMRMPVKQKSFTHLRVLLVLTDRGILAHSKLASVKGGFDLHREDPCGGHLVLL